MTNATADRWTYSANLTPTQLERFWSKVDRGKPDECWPWLGSLRDGYGNFATKRDGKQTSTTAHRLSYLIAGHQIPYGLVIDHLCRNRACVNPKHLEPVTSKVNTQRSPLVVKDECSNGHAFAEFGFISSGHRYCRICSNERAKHSMRRHRRRNGAVPFAERTHCGRGHELTPENIVNDPRRPNQRQCRICKNWLARERYARAGR